MTVTTFVRHFSQGIPDDPAEIRGEFKPIATNVAGIQICEHLPRLARLMDKVTIIRSIVGMEDRHEAFQTYTGRMNRNQPPGVWPAMGALLARLQGSGDPAIPAYLGLAPKMGHVPWSDNGVAGYPGSAHAPFEINRGGGKEDMILNGITLDRFADLRHSPFREARLQPDSSASPRLSPTRRKGIQSRGAAAFTASVDAISLWA